MILYRFIDGRSRSGRDAFSRCGCRLPFVYARSSLAARCDGRGVGPCAAEFSSSV
jgi:hypothetical protein